MKTYQTAIIAFCAFALAACGAVESTNTPTASLIKFVEASKTKDIGTMKNLLSKSTIDAIKKAADAQNTTVDEILLNDNGTPLRELPETRNEKIENDAASVEVKNKTTGEFESVPFVKEDGVWKIALDKFIKDMVEKQKQATDAPVNSAADTQINEPAANNNK